MKQHFYSHLIEIDALHIELDLMDLTSDERHELMSLLEGSVHHLIMDTILSELSEAEKKEFLSHVASEKHDEIWKLLKKVKDIEHKIRQAADDLKKQMQHDIKEAKKQSA